MKNIKKLAFGNDHAAAEVRDTVKKYLQDMGYEVEDFGFGGQGSCDYPDFAVQVAKAVADKKTDKGVLICGTGIGMAVAANKVKGVIAAVCWNEDTARRVSAYFFN